MDHLRRTFSALTIDGGLFLSIPLVMALAISWAFFIDWKGPVDDLSASERSHLEECVMAERRYGEGAYGKRPDCRDVLQRPKTFASHR